MWILYTLFLLLLLMIVWLLWARMLLCINSYQRQYYFSMGGLIRVEPVEEEHRIFMRIKVPFYSFKVDPLETGISKGKPSKPDPEKKKPKKDQGRKLPISFYLKTIWEALNTFRVRVFHLDVDTGDFVLNAKITPVMVALSRGPAHLQVNYLGQAQVWIEIENKLVRFVPLAFRFIRKKYL